MHYNVVGHVTCKMLEKYRFLVTEKRKTRGSMSQVLLVVFIDDGKTCPHHLHENFNVSIRCIKRKTEAPGRQHHGSLRSKELLPLGEKKCLIIFWVLRIGPTNNTESTTVLY